MKEAEYLFNSIISIIDSAPDVDIRNDAILTLIKSSIGVLENKIIDRIHMLTSTSPITSEKSNLYVVTRPWLHHMTVEEIDVISNAIKTENPDAIVLVLSDNINFDIVDLSNTTVFMVEYGALDSKAIEYLREQDVTVLERNVLSIVDITGNTAVVSGYMNRSPILSSTFSSNFSNSM